MFSKNSSPKFRKMEYFKKLLIFQQGTLCTRKIKKNTQKIFFIIGEMKFSSHKLKKILYFFSKERFLYFRRELAKPENQKFLLFLQRFFPYFRMTANDAVK